MRFSKSKNGSEAGPNVNKWLWGLLNLSVTKWMASHSCSPQKRWWSACDIGKLSQGGKPGLSSEESVL